MYSKIPGEISLPMSKEMALGTGGGGCGGGGWAGGGWSGGRRFSLSVEEDPQFQNSYFRPCFKNLHNVQGVPKKRQKKCF